MATHYPRLTPGLHAQYVEIVTSHVEHDLGRHLASVSGGPAWASTDLWAALAQACRRCPMRVYFLMQVRVRVRVGVRVRIS